LSRSGAGDGKRCTGGDQGKYNLTHEGSPSFELLVERMCAALVDAGLNAAVSRRSTSLMKRNG
jgi:hypothetical protein